MTNKNKQTIVESQHQNTMLDYAKEILPKVRFSKELFRKELHKCIHWVEPDQIQALYKWCYEKFNKVYPDVLAEAFADNAA